MTITQAPTKTLVKSVNHTSITVTELDRVLEFLIDGLGFELLSREPRDPAMMSAVTGVENADAVIAFVQAPGHRIELINYLKPVDREAHKIRPCDDGFWHLALDVTDIDLAVAIGGEHQFIGVTEPLEVSHGPNKGLFCCYLRDPYGLTVEVIGPRV